MLDGSVLRISLRKNRAQEAGEALQLFGEWNTRTYAVKYHLIKSWDQLAMRSGTESGSSTGLTGNHLGKHPT